MFRRLFNSLLLAIFLLQASFTPANFDELMDNAKNETPEFLPVEEAFSVAGRIDNGHAYIDFKITPGHYLYKERLKFFTSASIPYIGEPVYPTSKNKFDPNFNRNVDIFTDDITIKLPVKTSSSAPNLDISFQGCADAGLCYPPHKVTILLTSSASNAENRFPLMEETREADERYYEKRLKESGILISILLFLVTGIGLSFTPCVLPMIPIMSSIILGGYQPNRTKIIALTMTYIVSMSVTFAIAGTLTGLFGASLNLQAKLQSPWLIYPFAMLFVLLALSMFGLYELQLPASIREKLGITPKKQGNITSAAVMGFLSALVVSPCVSAPLAGSLIYISTTEDALLGGLSLFSLGLGMGAPLLAIALGGKQILPKSGPWMESVRAFFGVLMLAVAIWMLERVITARISLALWGSLAIGCSIFLGALNFNGFSPYKALKQTAGILLLVYGICLIVGFAKGNTDPFAPLASEPKSIMTGQNQITFQKVTTLKELNAALAAASKENKPVLLDIYADWCISCKVIEKKIFPSPEIKSLLPGFALIKLDITSNTNEHTDFLNQHQLFGPPAFIFYDINGIQQPQLKLTGEPSAQQFKEHLEKLLSMNKI